MLSPVSLTEINKQDLLKQIVHALKQVHQGAVDAASRAHDTATAQENEAENKYDTLGLEAAYLAHGQSQRVAECEVDLLAFDKLMLKRVATHLQGVSSGALFILKDEQGVEQTLFLGPAAGGLKISYMGRDVLVITPSAPLGKAVLGCLVGDEVDVMLAGQKKYYQVIDIC
ncbi:Transcription elongation factor [hydrothermal vent metagenome]|uniref:Transcription elongation factor n=1 Tax=hydrothermal vent metagenome TaxID=652676 RepID=A0A3B0YNL3_9ZZZZ